MEEKKQEENRFTKTTLGELGATLPVGIIGPDGQLRKELAHGDWTTRKERQIGKSKKKNMNQAEHVSLILSNLYRQVGHETWDPDSLDDKKRRLEYGGRLSQMYSGDIFYMYMWLRRNVIGPIVEIEKMTCAMCEAEFAWEGDLDTVEVTTVSKPEEMDWKYRLHKSFQYQGKEATELTLRSPRWGAFESETGNVKDVSSGRILAVYSSVVAVNDVPTILGPADLDDMTKRDLELITKKLDQNYIGPRMVIESDCPSCERNLITPIDWRHDSFFSSSSR